MHTRSWPRRHPWLSGLIVLLIAFVVVIGPWPLDETPYTDQDYTRATLQRIASAQPYAGHGELYAGIATADISPAIGVPLAGYGARDPKANTGTAKPITTTALTLKAGNATITILTADLLLPTPDLVNAVLEQSGLDPRALFISATHTHSGPGAFQPGLIEEAVLGDFDPAVQAQLAQGMAKAIAESRANLVPVRARLMRDQPTGPEVRRMVFDRLADQDGYAALSALQLFPLESGVDSKAQGQANGDAMATLITFAAHPTCLGPANHRAHPDYPGPLRDRIQAQTGGEVMFLAGAMGSMKTGMNGGELGDDGKPLRCMDNMTKSVGNAYLGLLGNSAKERWAASAGEPVAIASMLIDVDMPPPNHQVIDGIRLSPIISRVAHDGVSQLHVLRIGKLYLVGFPADYSGELAGMLKQWGREHGAEIVSTSFNGDWVGYLVPSFRYDIHHYETRTVGLFGRWVGDYFTELAKQAVLRLQKN